MTRSLETSAKLQIVRGEPSSIQLDLSQAMHHLTFLSSYQYSFKTLYAQLRELKTEIEHIQHLLEKAKVKLQKDFEQWWNQQSDNTKVSILDLYCMCRRTLVPKPYSLLFDVER